MDDEVMDNPLTQPQRDEVKRVFLRISEYFQQDKISKSEAMILFADIDKLSAFKSVGFLR